MIEKYSDYEFKVINCDDGLWDYQIYDEGIIYSDDSYDTAQEARFAAIGHIDLLENGEE